MMSGAGVAVVVIVAIIAVVAGWGIGSYITPNKGSSSTYGTTITEIGSSLVYPAVFYQWGPNYTAFNPKVLISSGPGGSGLGQSDAIAGLVDIGGSDAYLSNATTNNLVNFPMAISSQLVYYNLPGVTAHLNLNATIVAGMYLGTITSWNDPMIQAANPGVSLPSTHDIPVARSDGSGDTFLITQYMYMGSLAWSNGGHAYGTAKISGGTLASNILYANGNSGMVTTTAASGSAGAVAYIGISYESEAAAHGLQYAYLGDNLANSASGGVDPANYIGPSPQNISYDANLALTKLHFAPPYANGLALVMILGAPSGGATDVVPGAGGSNPTSAYPTPYPDVNLEYGLVKSTGAPGGSGHSWYVVQFLQWVITIGNLPQYLDPVHFLPMTPALVADDYTLLGTIQTSPP